LNEIQEKITLPAHLPKEQQGILKDPKRKNYIEQNPVVIEIEGLTHKYTSLVLPATRPPSKKIYKDAIRNMSTQEDWANLETLFAGFKKAGIVLKSHHFGFATRIAIVHEQLFSVIDCARHAQDTGYLLKTDESGLMVLSAIANRATTENHTQAIKWLEQVQDILERPPHSDLSGLKDLRSSRLARGMMVAARLSDIQASESPSETQLTLLGDEVERLRAVWLRPDAATDGPLELEIDQLGLNSLRRRTRTKADGATHVTSMSFQTIGHFHIVQMIAHNIKACEGAPAVLGQTCEPLPDIGKKIDDYLTGIITDSAELDAHFRNRLPVLALAYQRVLGRAPTWAEPAADAAT
jgi:hypothetical protein